MTALVLALGFVSGLVVMAWGWNMLDTLHDIRDELHIQNTATLGS